MLSFIVKPNDLLLEAEKNYDLKNYKKSIALYEQLVSEGYISSELYYNLGNAYYRNNQLGKAIFNYERANKLNPKDNDVKNNLALAYSKTIDKIEVKENFFINVVKTNVLNSCDTTAWAWITIGTCFLFFVSLYFFIACNSVGLKRVSFFASLVVLILFFVFYFLGLSAKNSKLETNFAVITSPQVKIYTEPSANSLSKFSLHEGTRIKIIDKNSEWVLIKLENGNEGWLKLSEVGVF